MLSKPSQVPTEVGPSSIESDHQWYLRAFKAVNDCRRLSIAPTEAQRISYQASLFVYGSEQGHAALGRLEAIELATLMIRGCTTPQQQERKAELVAQRNVTYREQLNFSESLKHYK